MLPESSTPKDVTHTAASLASFKAVILNAAEVLSDTSVAIHDGNWQSLPDAIKKNLDGRFPDAQKALFS
jgi:hypothetical protein